MRLIGLRCSSLGLICCNGGPGGLLRPYALPTTIDPMLAVRAYSLTGGHLLAETVVTLPYDLLANLPRHSEPSLSLDVPDGENWSRVRIEPLNGGFQYWAFITTTNNQTQTISITTPQ